MDKHPIDDLFRRHLNDRRWSFSENDWQDALTLIREDDRQRRRAVWWWWLLGFVAVIAVTALAFWSWRTAPSLDVPVLAIENEVQGAMGDAQHQTPLAEPTFNGRTAAEEQDVPAVRSILGDNENKVDPYSEKPKDPVGSISATKTNRTRKTVSASTSRSPVTEDMSAQGPTPEKERFIADSRHIALPAPQLLPSIVSGVSALQSVWEPMPVVFNAVVNETGLPITDKILPLRRALPQGFTLQSYSDVYRGLIGTGDRFHDHAVRAGYQWAIHRNFGVEPRIGVRLFAGSLPVHAQVAQVSYAIGHETTTFQLQADRVIMAGAGLTFHAGIGRHRFSAGVDGDRVIAAYGDFREQFFSQERKLQDRNTRPVTVAERRSWLALEGLERWQFTSELSYRYEIAPRLELGLSWLHRYEHFVRNDDLPSDRLSFSIKKIF